MGDGSARLTIREQILRKVRLRGHPAVEKMWPSGHVAVVFHKVQVAGALAGGGYRRAEGQRTSRGRNGVIVALVRIKRRRRRAVRRVPGPVWGRRVRGAVVVVVVMVEGGGGVGSSVDQLVGELGGGGRGGLHDDDRLGVDGGGRCVVGVLLREDVTFVTAELRSAILEPDLKRFG